jgi:peroxiredoxin
MSRFAIGSLVLVSAALAAQAAVAANKLNIGDAAPQWTNLVGADGSSHSLPDYKEAKALVVVFTCNHCPVAQAYQDRLVAIQKDYKDKGVQVVAICSNKGSADNLEAMKQRATSAGFNFPYLCDATQQAGRDFGAKCTPHVFVFNKDRKLAYVGAIDDNWQEADKVQKQYLRSALDSVLDGKTPAKTSTSPVGCKIGYD